MLKIGIDLDNTLAPTTETIIKYTRETKKKYTFKGLNSTKQYTIEEKEKFYNFVNQTINQQHPKSFLPIKDTVDIIPKLAKKHKLYILTGRTHKNEKPTKKWVDTHFPKQFQKIVFSKYVNVEQYIKNKGQRCKEYKIDVLVDDVLDNIWDCHKKEINTILFDFNKQYSWTKGKIPKTTKIAHDWIQVSEMIEEMDV